MWGSKGSGGGMRGAYGGTVGVYGGGWRVLGGGGVMSHYGSFGVGAVGEAAPY